MSQVTGLGTVQPQSFYRYNKPEARPYTVVAQDPEHGDFGPFTPGTKTSGLQEAINFVASLGGGEIFIKNNGGLGYPIYVDIVPPPNIPLKLVSDHARIYAAYSGGVMIHPSTVASTSPANLVEYPISMEGLVLDANGLANVIVGPANGSAVSGVWLNNKLINTMQQGTTLFGGVYNLYAAGNHFINYGPGDTVAVDPYGKVVFEGNTFQNVGLGGDLGTGGIVEGTTVNGQPVDMSWEIIGNSFIGQSPNYGEAVDMENSFGKTIKNVTIAGNVFKYGGVAAYTGNAANAGPTYNIVISGNAIDTGDIGINLPANRVIIKGNVVYNSYTTGLFVASGGSATPVTDLIVEGNTFENSNLGQNSVNLQNYAGISLINAASAIIRGNTFRRTDTTTYGTPAFIAVNNINPAAAPANVLIEGNVFEGTPSQWNNILINNTALLPTIYIQDNINAIPVVVGTYQNATPNTPGSVLFFRLRRNPNPSGFAGITQLVSGTTYQNPYPFALNLLIPVTLTPTSTAAASASIAVGSSPSTLSTVQTLSAAAGASPTGGVLQAAVPAGQYYQITLTNATAYQPIVLS